MLAHGSSSLEALCRYTHNVRGNDHACHPAYSMHASMRKIGSRWRDPIVFTIEGQDCIHGRKNFAFPCQVLHLDCRHHRSLFCVLPFCVSLSVESSKTSNNAYNKLTVVMVKRAYPVRGRVSARRLLPLRGRVSARRCGPPFPYPYPRLSLSKEGPM